MYLETMDLFDQLDDPPPSASQPKRFARDDADRLLDNVISNSSRKSSYKALSQEERERLADAVALVSMEKRAAYDLARGGFLAPAAGWIVDKPELAAATALLNQHFISDIPMARGDDAVA